MPRGNGLGPPGNGTQRGGRMQGNRPGAGPQGNCICPQCGEKMPHDRGMPCFKLSCPKCGTPMVRE